MKNLGADWAPGPKVSSYSALGLGLIGYAFPSDFPERDWEIIFSTRPFNRALFSFTGK